MWAEGTELLCQLESALWATTTRRDRDWMDEHLSPTFSEFGRSGNSYTRAEILDHQIGEIDVVIPFPDLVVRPLGNDMALATYRTIEPLGHSHRASIWRRAGNRAGWQLEFRQGTPTTP